MSKLRAAGTLSGRIVSDKMDKTVTVLVSRSIRHPLYGKLIKRSVRLKAHDEHNEGTLGAEAIVRSSRPYSKTKHWELVSVKSAV